MRVSPSLSLCASVFQQQDYFILVDSLLKDSFTQHLDFYTTFYYWLKRHLSWIYCINLAFTSILGCPQIHIVGPICSAFSFLLAELSLISFQFLQLLDFAQTHSFLRDVIIFLSISTSRVISSIFVFRPLLLLPSLLPDPWAHQGLFMTDFMGVPWRPEVVVTLKPRLAQVLGSGAKLSWEGWLLALRSCLQVQVAALTTPLEELPVSAVCPRAAVYTAMTGQVLPQSLSTFLLTASTKGAWLHWSQQMLFIYNLV